MSDLVYKGVEEIDVVCKIGYLRSGMYDEFRDDPRFIDILEKHKELYEENLEKYGDLVL